MIKTILKVSKIEGAGIGVFSLEDISKNTIIFFHDPTDEVFVDRDEYESLEELKKYGYKVSFNRYLVPKDFNNLHISWFLNHSENPNAKMDIGQNIISIIDIKKGDEITINYNTLVSFKETEEYNKFLK